MELDIDTSTLSLLQQTTRYFSEQHRQAYLVGGSLRNLLLGEECLDWDIVTPRDAHTIARKLADTLGGHYVHMHEKASRIVIFIEDAGSPDKKNEMHIDISPLTGETIENDLRHRDFTINAMAAPLHNVVRYLESQTHAQQPVGARVVARGRVGLYGRPPWVTWRRWLLMNRQHPDKSSSPSVGARVVARGKVGLYGRPPWVTWRRWLSMNRQHPYPRATIKAHPTSSQPPSPLQYNEENEPYIASLAGAIGSRLIDPLNGLADLQARLLKAVDDQVFHHDPLRMLRAVRLMMRYQLHIDPWTESLIKRDASLLPEVAPERVHDELYAILGPGGAASRLHFLDEHNIFMVIFPEFAPARGMPQPKPHHWDVLTHSIETVSALEHISTLIQANTDTVGAPFMGARRGGAAVPPNLDLAEISSLLQEAEQQGIFSFAGLTAPRMKLAALLHDIGKPATYSRDQEGAIHFYNHPLAGVPLVEQVMRRLCASTQDRRLAQLVAAHHMRPGQLGHDGPVTPRAIRRYFVDLGPTGIYVALFSLADHLATLGPQPTADSWQRHLEVVRLLLTRYIRERDSILPPRLISPEELMRRLKLNPGPTVGQLLDLIAEAQADGTIHSKEEAVWFAEEHLNTL